MRSFTAPNSCATCNGRKNRTLVERASANDQVHIINCGQTVNAPDSYYDDFEEDLQDPQCVQRIYDFSLRQVRGLVDYNDEDDVIQEVFYRLTKWPIGKMFGDNYLFPLTTIKTTG